jgi:c-di-GMP-binding flagellar brake protein YcgR
MSSERRKLSRWKLDKPIKIKLEGAQAFIEALLRDINFCGCQILLRQKLPKDTFLKLMLVISKDSVLEVEAWAVWQRNINGRQGYGLYFSKISTADKEKIYRFVYQNAPQQIAAAAQTERGAKMEDRRIFARFKTKLPVTYLEGHSGRQGRAITQDISAKGMGLVANEALPQATPLEFWLEMPDQGAPIYSRGQVAWSKQVEPDVWRMGVDLEKADLMGLSRILRKA